jgi:hypothetical protein
MVTRMIRVREPASASVRLDTDTSFCKSHFCYSGRQRTSRFAGFSGQPDRSVVAGQKFQRVKHQSVIRAWRKVWGHPAQDSGVLGRQLLQTVIVHKQLENWLCSVTFDAQPASSKLLRATLANTLRVMLIALLREG